MQRDASLELQRSTSRLDYRLNTFQNHSLTINGTNNSLDPVFIENEFSHNDRLQKAAPRRGTRTSQIALRCVHTFKEQKFQVQSNYSPMNSWKGIARRIYPADGVSVDERRRALVLSSVPKPNRWKLEIDLPIMGWGLRHRRGSQGSGG